LGIDRLFLYEGSPALITTCLKKIALAAGIIFVFPLVLFVWIGRAFNTESVFDMVAQGISLLPGIPGNYLRLGFYILTLRSVKPNVVIQFVTFFTIRTASIGSNVCIGAYSIIGNAEIEDGVLIGSRVSLMSGKYQHGGGIVQSSASGEGRFERITIGEKTWIGEGSIVGANIGRGCVVAAGSVVMRDIPNGYLVSGNPAKLVRISSWSTSLSPKS